MLAVKLRSLLLFGVLPIGIALLSGAPLWPLFLGYAGYALLVTMGARRSRRLDKAGSVAFLLFLIFGLPVAFASVTAASWTAILIAYGIWFGLLGLWAVQGLMSRQVRTGEALGWPLIGAMFLTMVAVRCSRCSSS
jgi:hypothetical protein